MSEVTTRPAAGATRALPRHKNISPRVAQEGPRAPAVDIDALSGLAFVLDEAANTVETDIYSGESDRLLRVAHALADEIHTCPTECGFDSTIANRAFTITALVNAAMAVPGDTASPARQAFVATARTYLVRLSNCKDVLDGWETYQFSRIGADNISPAEAVSQESLPCPPLRQQDALLVICAHVSQAAAIARVAAESDDGSNAVWGAVRLMDHVHLHLESLKGRSDFGSGCSGVFPDACSDISTALAVLELVNEAEQNQLLYAAATLLQVAISDADAEVDFMIQQARGERNA